MPGGVVRNPPRILATPRDSFDNCLGGSLWTSCKIFGERGSSWPISGGIIRRLLRQIAESSWEILANSWGHGASGNPWGNRAKSLRDTGQFLGGVWGQCLGESCKILLGSWRLLVTASTIALGGPSGHRATSLGSGGSPGQFLEAFSGDCFGQPRKVLGRS